MSIASASSRCSCSRSPARVPSRPARPGLAGPERPRARPCSRLPPARACRPTPAFLEPSRTHNPPPRATQSPPHTITASTRTSSVHTDCRSSRAVEREHPVPRVSTSSGCAARRACCSRKLLWPYSPFAGQNALRQARLSAPCGSTRRCTPILHLSRTSPSARPAYRAMHRGATSCVLLAQIPHTVYHPFPTLPCPRRTDRAPRCLFPPRGCGRRRGAPSTSHRRAPHLSCHLALGARETAPRRLMSLMIAVSAIGNLKCK